MPSLRENRERDFNPVVSSYFQTYITRKTRSLYLSAGRALFTHTHTHGTWRSLIYLERITLTSFASHLTAATKCNPWIKLPRGALNRSTAKKLNNGSVQTQCESSTSIEVANYSEMHKNELQKAIYWLMSSGQQACFLVTRTSPDHSISLCPQTTHPAHVNHPAC